MIQIIANRGKPFKNVYSGTTEASVRVLLILTYSVRQIIIFSFKCITQRSFIKKDSVVDDDTEISIHLILRE